MVEAAHFKIDWEEHSVTPVSRYPLIPSERGPEPSENNPKWLRDTLEELQTTDTTEPDELAKVIQRGADRWFDRLTELKSKFLNERRQIISEFETRIRDRWGNALELYELLLIFAQDVNMEFSQSTFTAEANYRNEAIVRLHRRACLSAAEILVLLRAGFAPGAQARWRTLHELVVVALFLLHHDDILAERFLLHHDIVDRFKVADMYRQRGLYEEDDRYATLQRRYAELGTRYGSAFLKDWGWAAGEIKGNPNFKRVEETVGLDRYRPSYKVASRAVHSNSSNGLASIYSMEGIDVPLIGPTNAGVAEPATSALDSLTKITVILLDQRHDPDR